MRRPTQDDRCSSALRTGWTTQDQPCSDSRVPLERVDAVHDLVELTPASWVIRAGA
jgi:hypothetical protein